MGTMIGSVITVAKKDDYIRVRVTTEEKQLFKDVATELGVSMSELMVVATENIVKKHKEKMLSQKNIEDRAIRTEKKLLEISERIRGNNNRKKSSKKRRFIFLGDTL